MRFRRVVEALGALCLQSLLWACHETPKEAAPAPEAAIASASPLVGELPVATPKPIAIAISAVGDCTLGHAFENGNGISLFDRMLASRDQKAYPFSGVSKWLASDDLTIANLEGALTSSSHPIPEGKFHFRAKPEHARLLVAGGIEVANIANNHTGDFGPRGYQDTIAALREAGVGICGNGLADRREIHGVEVVNVGFAGLYATRENVKRDIIANKKPNNLLIASFHWGVEGSHYVIEPQRELGRAAIDAGADLVLGTHPHVVQAIETYQGRHIVYSLGNFVFGANTNPTKIESMIYTETFEAKDGRMVSIASEIVPVKICEQLPCKEFRPLPMQEPERSRFLRWIEEQNQRIESRPFVGRSL